MNWSLGHEDTHTAPCSIYSSVVVVSKPISYVPSFSRCLLLSKLLIPIEYQVYIGQVSQKLSLGDARQMWKYF